MVMAYQNNEMNESPDTTNQAGTDRVVPDDHALIDCMRQGENRCYDIFVRRFGSRVLAVTKRYLRSEADAADCFQDTFIAAFNNIDRFEERSSLGTWLRAITVNQCLMHIRTNGRRREESIDHLLPEFDESGKRVASFEPAGFVDAGERIDQSQTKSVVRSKIYELPDDYRTILLLRDIDGYSTQETAEKLGIKIHAVKTRLHRARSALKTLLQPELERLN